MTTTLADALAALVAAARTAGVDETAARIEGESVAAVVSEVSRGAFVDWCAQTERASSAEPFTHAAAAGRRFREAPTPLMAGLVAAGSPYAAVYADALSAVALAGADLGTPHPTAIGRASSITTAQLGSVSTTPSPATPSGPGRIGVGPPREAVPGVLQAFLGDVLARSKDVSEQLQQLRADPLVDVRGTSPDTSGVAQEPPGPEVSRLGPGGPHPPTTGEPPPSGSEKPAEPEVPQKTIEELLAELDELVGLTDVKAEIRRQAAVLRVEGLRKDAGLTSPTITRHLVFNGNPGTGKTTVARLVAGIYRALGLLSKGQLIEVDRSELVAGFLGQTAIKTSDVVKTAIGGVLFIDEAYSLVGGPQDQYGLEAIDTLVKEMEDHRGDLVVIVAGYPVPMAVFIAQNPGLASRFRTHIDFPDYSDDELVEIFGVMAKDAEYDVDQDGLDRLRALLSTQVRDSAFGNARYVRNTLEAAIGQQAWRLRDIDKPTIEQLRTLVADDLGADPADGPQEPVDWPPSPTGQKTSAVSPQDTPTGQKVSALSAEDEAL